MDECCCNTIPPGLQLARATSNLRATFFNVRNVDNPALFCGRRLWRHCTATGADNGLCLPQATFSSAGDFPGFETAPQGAPPANPNCAGNARDLLPVGPVTEATEQSLRCTWVQIPGGNACWNAVYQLSVEVTLVDLIAVCVANLGLIDINAVPFGTDRSIRNVAGGGVSIGDAPITAAGLPAPFCTPAPGFTHASWLHVEWQGHSGATLCSDDPSRRISFPTREVIIRAGRTRFSAGATWCLRTKTPISGGLSEAADCFSPLGTCAVVDCKHLLPAVGIIGLPLENHATEIALCTNPGSPCNPTPIAFSP